MKEYVTLSLETHLFFGRIMKEYSIFLLAGFPAKETEFIRKAMNVLKARTLQPIKQYMQFKTAGIEGITGCEIRSIILPLLADYVLREANHYLRILEYAQKGRGLYGIV